MPFRVFLWELIPKQVAKGVVLIQTTNTVMKDTGNPNASLRWRLIPGAKHLQQLLDAELGEKLLYIVDFQDQEFPWSVCSSWSLTYVGPCPEELSQITLALPTSQTSLQSLEADFILFYFLTSSGNCESSWEKPETLRRWLVLFLLWFRVNYKLTKCWEETKDSIDLWFISFF